MQRIEQEVVSYFKSKILHNTTYLPLKECWLWHKATNQYKYGIFTFRKKQYIAHRIAAHIWLNFDLQSPLFVCHTCDTPSCCNPDHLIIADAKWNMQDAMHKNRLRTGRNHSSYKHGKCVQWAHDVNVRRTYNRAYRLTPKRRTYMREYQKQWYQEKRRTTNDAN